MVAGIVTALFVPITAIGPVGPGSTTSAASGGPDPGGSHARGAGDPGSCLAARRLERAERYAGRRRARVSFAFADECGRVVGGHRNRVHASASVVKVMLLVAYLRQEVGSERLSRSQRRLLGPMITESSNRSANTVFGIVGRDGLERLARKAGMRRFASSPSWGGSGIAAADQARFANRIERFVPRPHEGYVLRLMRSVIPKQSWGVADATPRGWRAHFKGGWYSTDGQGHHWRVNQVATLRRGDRRIGLAVLSDGNNSFRYGRETVRRLARILLSDYRG